MPILNVDQARSVVVIKRSLSPGFAGIANPLFAAENSLMLFGDAKKTILDHGRAQGNLVSIVVLYSRSLNDCFWAKRL